MPRGTWTAESRAKAAATRAANRAEKLAAVGAGTLADEPPQVRSTDPATVAETVAPTLADFGLGVPETDLRVDDILSNERIAEIEEQARKKVRREQEEERTKAFFNAAVDRERRRLGTEPVDEAREREMNEPTWIRINLPRLRLATGRECPADPIILDQRVFVHGWSGYVPRHQADYLMDRMARAWEHVAQVDGRTRTYYNEQVGTMYYQGGTASGGGSLGSSFDSVHRRPATHG